MKKLIWLILLLASCNAKHNVTRETISLAGDWRFRIDSLDRGVSEKWYNDLPSETIHLPGSMAENGKGEEITLKTDWTGEIVDKSYFTDNKYAKYRQPGNIKIPFWLQPVKYYKGVAWYYKEVDIPSKWHGKNIILNLERPHWETTVFVNSIKAGTENSLAVTHQYNLTDLLHQGKNLISVRVDNRIVVPVGINSHSISDHTQTDWNGIVGDINLEATSKVFIKEIRVNPDIQAKKARVIVTLTNKSGVPFEGKLFLQARSFNLADSGKLKKISIPVKATTDRLTLFIDYPMDKKMSLWSEFSPSLYNIDVDLRNKSNAKIDSKRQEFGMRDFKTSGTHFEVNGHQIFLRGTVECCIFPLTGYPPTDLKSWMKELGKFKEYGLNMVRFHSWCPPEAAFCAADRLGMYLQIECSSWANSGATVGDGSPADEFIYRESDRILDTYGNHPSFCMLTYGNEPAGNNQNTFLGKLIGYWKNRDNRRVYTSGSGWPVIPENDYNLIAEPRIQRWGEGLKSIINMLPPHTTFDYHDIISKYKIPVVSHEIGQWCAYPDFREIPKYTGVLKPTNFEIFKETLTENGMGDQAESFLMASGKLQVLCYKADIEAALRTNGFAGFHLLQLNDFPGQGTALVGVLNSFLESKGYVTPEEFRMFCNSTVPLARMEKMMFRSSDIFKAEVEIAHFGEKPFEKATVICQVTNGKGDIVRKEIFTKDKIDIGNCIPVGTFQMDLSDITTAQKFTFEVDIANTNYKNSWDFWVYPDEENVDRGNVLITEKLDMTAEAKLRSGGSVLLLNYGKIKKGNGAEVAIGFSDIFWNTAWTGNQAPHTLGILCDPAHPVFKNFPTEFHSNWQWWDPVSHCQAMIIDKFPVNLRPLIQPIDTWFNNRRLALAFEVLSGGGKVMVCSIDLKNIAPDRIVSKQLLISILKYMNSASFSPKTEVSIDRLRELD